MISFADQAVSEKPQHKCPARGTTCYRCNRKGQFGSQCLSKTVAETITEGVVLDTLFVRALNEKDKIVMDCYGASTGMPGSL